MPHLENIWCACQRLLYEYHQRGGDEAEVEDRDC